MNSIEYMRQWREANPGALRKYKLRQAANRMAAWRKRNPEKAKENAKKQNAKNREYQIQWRIKNAGRYKAAQARWKKNNPKTIPTTGCSRILGTPKNRGPYLGSERKSVPRYDPLVNKGSSRGRRKGFSVHFSI
jgi:hypothetical protein